MTTQGSSPAESEALDRGGRDRAQIEQRESNGGCMNEVCMLTPISTPNQIRSMPIFCATGATAG